MAERFLPAGDVVTLVFLTASSGHTRVKATAWAGMSISGTTFIPKSRWVLMKSRIAALVML